MINVLDKGYVELLEMMGYDFTPVEAARVSFGKEKYEDTERNIKLLKYLYENDHTATLEHIVLKFRIKAPIFVFRQVMRSRVCSFNERSGRFSEFDEGEWYIPDKMRIQCPINKQGSIEDLKGNLDGWKSFIDNHCKISYSLYQDMLKSGVAKELARIVLPVNFYSELVWTINLRSLFNFLKLRTDNHAQYEIREYANAILEIVKEKLPINAEMFDKYIRKVNGRKED